jgi:hypothetical protein
MNKFRDELAKKIREARNEWLFTEAQKQSLIDILWLEQANQLERDKVNNANKQVQDILNEAKSNSDYNKQTLFQENKISDNNEFIDKYIREKAIAEKLNQYYYNSNEWWFWWWFNSFYDEWSIVFAKSTWKSKIFTVEEWKLHDLNKNYRDFVKVWKFYVWITVDTKANWSLQQKIDWSENYSLINQRGEEIQALRWDLSFLNNENIYRENFKINNKEYYCFYDNDFEKIIDTIPVWNTYLKQKNWKFLFTNHSINDDNKYNVVKKWENWSENYQNHNDIEVKDIYEEYRSNQKPQSEKVNILPEYQILYKENTLCVDKIYDANGKTIFNADKDDYNLVYWSDTNNWIFLLNWIENWKYVKDVFINAQSWIKLQFDTMSWSTFIDWKVLKHFINNNNSELYNIDTWEKLWATTGFYPNEQHFQTVKTKEWKMNLVENKNAHCLKQEFDKILKVYNYDTEKVVIVENNWIIIDLHINN